MNSSPASSTPVSSMPVSSMPVSSMPVSSMPVAVTGTAVERIGELRTEIDACDAAIIELVQRRLAVSREIGALRNASGGTRLNLAREQQVLSRFREALGTDGAALGMMLLRQGRGVL